MDRHFRIVIKCENTYISHMSSHQDQHSQRKILLFRWTGGYFISISQLLLSHMTLAQRANERSIKAKGCAWTQPCGLVLAKAYQALSIVEYFIYQEQRFWLNTWYPWWQTLAYATHRPFNTCMEEYTWLRAPLIFTLGLLLYLHWSGTVPSCSKPMIRFRIYWIQDSCNEKFWLADCLLAWWKLS